jgi:polysaccharide biosynthesis protein PelB
MQPSKLSVQPTERPVLAPYWLLVLLATGVAGALWLLYPRQDLERRLSEAGNDSALSANYLHNLLRSDPHNPRLRLLLAKEQGQTEALDTMRDTLQPVLSSKDPDLARQALWLLWETTYRSYQKAAAQQALPAQSRLQRDLVQQLGTLVQKDWPPEQRQQLTRQALDLGQYNIGITLLRQQAQQLHGQPEQAAQLYERAAREALAHAQYTQCAELYLLARQHTQDAAQAKQYFLSAIATVQASGQPGAALALAERELGSLHSDSEVIERLVQLARAAGRPDIAEHYVKQLLRLALWQQWQQWQMHPSAQALPVLHTIAQPSGHSAVQQAPARYEDRAYLLDPALLRHPSEEDAAFSSPEAEKWQWLASSQKTPTAPPTAGIPPGLPFDDRIYSLGYQVFLENKNLEDAWRVAKAAVQQAPQHIVWHERLAQVSEWTGRLELALQHWLLVAKQTQNQVAWQAVLRLAPGLFDDAALVEGLRYELRRRPGQLTLLDELVAAYERLGTPQPALDYLRQQAPSAPVLQMLAGLAKRAGDLDLALASWQRLFQDPAQLTPELAMRAAVLALLKGQAAQGLAWLEAAQAKLPPGSPDGPDFWRLTAQIAQGQQRDALAVQAYRQLLQSETPELGDFDALIRLLQTDLPLQAAEVALRAWQEHDQPRHLLLALNLHISRNQWREAERLLQQIDPAPQAQRRALHRLRQEPEFLRLAGLVYQNTGRRAQARQYYEAGLRLAPQSAAMRQALLWLFIESNDASALRELLSRYEAQWSQDPELHDALASTYQSLSLPAIALERYLQPRVQAHRHDLLWLMNYADALDQNQQSDRAWRLRRHLLAQEWQKAQRDATSTTSRAHWLTEEGLDTTRRIARTRLQLTQRPGDAGFAVLRELLRLDRDARNGLSNAAAETAIGWLQDAGEYNAERGFLWQQYARSHSLQANRPLWAEITVALAEKDKIATGELLDTFDQRLPRYDRVNAAAAVGDVRLAQTAAFETQQDQPDDNPLHQQLVDNLLAFTPHAAAQVTLRQLDNLDETETVAQLHYPLAPSRSLGLKLLNTQRQSNERRALRDPSQEQAAYGSLRWQYRSGSSTVLQLGWRDSLASSVPLQLEHVQRLDNRLSLHLDLGSQLPTQESLVLRMGGMKDRLGMGLRYQATRLDHVMLSHWREKYALQTGADVGSGQHSSLSYTHTYRLDVPTVDVGAFWSSHSYDQRNPNGFSGADRAFMRYLPPGRPQLERGYLLPDNFQFYGVQLTTNLRFENDYIRALLPLASLAHTWHSRQGAGYSLRLGLAGSVLGADHLSLMWGLGKSGDQTPGLTQEVQLNYRYHF